MTTIIARGLRSSLQAILVNAKNPSSTAYQTTFLTPTISTGLPVQLSSKFFFATEATSHDTIDKMVKNNKIVVFMKGVPAAPKCGFSNAVCKIFEMHGIDNFDAHDVLADEALRQGIKDYSNWPTIPQVYINGEFVGGSDIMLEMHQNGELVEKLEKIGIKSALLSADEHKKK